VANFNASVHMEWRRTTNSYCVHPHPTFTSTASCRISFSLRRQRIQQQPVPRHIVRMSRDSSTPPDPMVQAINQHINTSVIAWSCLFMRWARLDEAGQGDEAVVHSARQRRRRRRRRQCIREAEKIGMLSRPISPLETEKGRGRKKRKEKSKN
jgi:hypothetical protein